MVRVRPPGWSCAALCLALAPALVSAPSVRADGHDVGLRGLDEAALKRVVAQLGSATEGAREAAAQSLRSLHEESLPALSRRIAALRRARPSVEATRAALTAFRRATGSKSADDQVDIAAGVLPVLRDDRSGAVVEAAEVVLYARALEQLDSPAAGELLAQLIALDEPGVWDFELRLLRQRAGMALLPTLIRLRSHEDGRVRAYAQAGVRALEMEDPLVATALPDARLVAEVVRAYGEPLDFSAMTTVVRLAGHEKIQVRAAARETIGRFGKNAIWQLRELYQEVTGQAADRAWEAPAMAHKLYSALDQGRNAQTGTLLERGLQTFVDGDLEAMQRAFDRLLAIEPGFADRGKLAPGYAALGALRLSQDRLEDARDAYARSVRLGPALPDVDAHRAQLAFVDAEIALSYGVVDLNGYRRALALDPDHDAAAAALDRLSGEAQARVRRNQRLAAGAAAVLVIGMALVLLRSRRGAATARAATSDA
jgi:tetratricopeptide (TPR) repeat protein